MSGRGAGRKRPMPATHNPTATARTGSHSARCGRTRNAILLWVRSRIDIRRQGADLLQTQTPVPGRHDTVLARVDGGVEGLGIAAAVPDVTRQVRRAVVAIAPRVGPFAVATGSSARIHGAALVRGFCQVGAAVELQQVLNDIVDLSLAQDSPQTER